MKSNRSLRTLKGTNTTHQRESNSPTLDSSYSEKRFLTKSYQYEPFPKQLKRRLIGHKFKFSDFSDEEEDNSGVVLEQEQIEVLEKKKVLPHFKLINDRGEFLATRSRIKSERKFDRHSPRCKSVESLKLPQVMEEKKEEDELQKLQRCKLSQFKDHNQFNQHSVRLSENNSLTDRSRESIEPNHCTTAMPELIVENEAEETKSDKLKQDKSMLVNEFEKMIVDEVDDKKRKKEESQQKIEEIIQEQKQEEEFDTVNKLRVSLEKLELSNHLLNKFMVEQLRVQPHSDSKIEGPASEQANKAQDQHNYSINEQQHNE